MDHDPRYPIGRFDFAGPATPAERAGHIARIAEAPARLRDAVAGLDEAGLEATYRPGGWTIRQVAHHLPDSHLNAVVRFRLALTEERPTIKPYDEAKWAGLPDASRAPVDASLRLLEALHERWVHLLAAMAPGDFARLLIHPEQPEPVSLDFLLALYDWHGRHHVAQIEQARGRRGG